MNINIAILVVSWYLSGLLGAFLYRWFWILEFPDDRYVGCKNYGPLIKGLTYCELFKGLAAGAFGYLGLFGSAFVLIARGLWYLAKTYLPDCNTKIFKN